MDDEIIKKFKSFSKIKQLYTIEVIATKTFRSKTAVRAWFSGKRCPKKDIQATITNIMDRII